MNDKDIIADIVGFWLADSLDAPENAYARRDWWYKGGPTVDDEIRARFGGLVTRACAGDLAGWGETPDGALAQILLLDQFTRNLYRNTPEAYAGDALAFAYVNETIDKGLDRDLHPVCRIWLYHPFHHSEEIVEQERGGALLKAVRDSADPAWHAYIDRSIWGWGRHRDIVARFGRFPHRNAVLGRESTPEELAHMAEGGESFGQGVRSEAASEPAQKS